MIVEHYDRVRSVLAQQQQALTVNASGKSRGISDELIHDLVDSSGMLVDDLLAVAYWSVTVMKDGLTKRVVLCKSPTRVFEVLKMMIHA